LPVANQTVTSRSCLGFGQFALPAEPPGGRRRGAVRRRGCAILEGVAAILKLGTYEVDPPVVLAPMAGITNVAFRQLCREQGAGLYVCEMVTTRALVERNPKTLRM